MAQKKSSRPSAASSDTGVSLSVEDIYKVLCAECKDRLLTMAAKTVSTDSVKKQLKEQWEDKES